MTCMCRMPYAVYARVQVLLVEEAAEVYEAHVLVCLSRSVEHLVLIGDHEQLRPKPNEYCLQVESGRWARRDGVCVCVCVCVSS